MKRSYLLILAFIFSIAVSAQHHFSFTHYTSDNGLSQNSITTLMKDRKGYIWFGTRDGLNKFDGYNFTVYNSRQVKGLSTMSNRILVIKEDKWGYIWVKTYDEFVYRLNPLTDEQTCINHPKGGYITDKIRQIITLPSGTVWLTTLDKGCYKVSTIEEVDEETGEDTKKLEVKLYSKKQKNLPNDSIRNVFQDQQKNTWILTSAGLVCIDQSGKSTTYFTNLDFYSLAENEKRIMFGAEGGLLLYEKRQKTFKTIPLPPTVVASSIACFNDNNYLIASPDKGFFTYDALHENLKQFLAEQNPEMRSNDIQQIYIDRAGDAWLGIKSPGVLHYSPQTAKITYVPTRPNEGQLTNPNYLIFEDEKDILWIQPYFGSFSWFDRSTNALIPFYNAYNEEINMRFSFGVNHALADSQGVLWISTNRGNGFFKCTFLPDYFNHYLLQNQSVFSIGNETRAIYEDREKRLWVASKDGAVHVFDENKREIGTLNGDGRIMPGGNMEVLVYNFFQDKAGNIWMATKRQGLFRLKPKGSSNAFQVDNFMHNPNNPYSLATNDFYSVTQDNYGRIWAGSYGSGLHLLNEQNGIARFIHAGNDLKTYPIGNCSKVRQVFIDSKHQIWVATTEGLITFSDNFKNPKDIKFTYHHKSEKAVNGLISNDIHCIFEDPEKNMWIGTFGGGLSKLKKKPNSTDFEYQVFNREKGMPSNIIYSILDDKQGSLWLTTENSIVKMNKKSCVIEAFGKGNELENVEFSEAAACLQMSGEICVGSKSGFYSFRPELVRRRVIKAPLVFTRLLLFNKEVKIGEEESILKEHIDHTPQLVFNHKQNVFTIEFSTLDLRAPEKVKYAYKLEGFDSDWNNVESKHFATYTALPPGTYTFRVKSTDSEGIWLDNERFIEVKILPSFWESGLAKFFYFLLIIGVFLLTLYIFLTIFKLKNNVQLEKQMTDMKLRFFTDISHELRTPLTLISLPIDSVLHENLEPHIKDQLTTVRRNLDRVMRLINQILDFRKIQNNKLRLTVEEVDFAELARTCSNKFEEIANNKNINFNFIDEAHNVKVWVDTEQFESIISNLLSNAFKFTLSGKSITVKTALKQDMAVLTVTDEGIGIAQEKINFIFDRFFSVSTLTNIAQKSTGIGLDLVKKLVDLHHASILVESQPGKGSTFEIDFKLGTSHFDGDVDIILSDEIKSAYNPDYEVNEILEPELERERDTIPTILIIEDSDELRHFLKQSLRKDYKVAEAENGVIGWRKIEQLLPDLIITDLRMPEMDGLELTQKVKDDKRVSHIPIILLTAVTDLDSKLQAMKMGVDDYITKPFSSELLHARVENLMNQRAKLQLFYRSQLANPKPSFGLPPLEVKSKEDQFMQNLLKLMDVNLDNFDLNIDLLATELGMSRTVFFNKLKNLTGLSPVEFVREIRFERAADYMRKTNLTVSEISYKVGIEDPRYFSRCFKQKFGVTPSEYRQQHSPTTES